MTRADKLREQIKKLPEIINSKGANIGNEEYINILRFQTPGLILDYDSLYDGFFDKDKRVTSNKIVALNKTKEVNESERSHIKDKDNSYDLFQKLFNKKYKSNSFLKGDISENDFKRDYLLTTEISMKELREIDYSDKEVARIADLLYELFSQDCFKLLAILENDEIEFHQLMNDIYHKNGDKRYDDLSNMIIRSSIPRYLPLNLYCYIYYSTHDDTKIENHFLYYHFTSSADYHNDSRYLGIVLYDPSPLFLKKMMYDSAMQGVNTVILLNDQSSFDLFSSVFNGKKNIKLFNMNDNIDSFDFSIMEGLTNSLLFFGNHNDDDALKESSLRFILNSMDIDTFFVFDKDSNIRSSYVKRNLDSYTIDSIGLLPKGITDRVYSSQKMLIKISKHKNDGSVLATHYTLKKQGRSNQSLCPKEYEMNIEEDLIFDKNYNLRSLFISCYQDSLKKTQRQRNKAELISFSPEIEIIFSCSYDKNKERYRVEASMVRKDDNDKVKRIESTLKRTNQKTVDDVKLWLLQKYPYETIKFDNGEIVNIRDIAISEFKNEYEDKPLSLRSFVYFYNDEIEGSIGKKQLDILNKIVSSGIGSMLISNINSIALNDSLDDVANEDESTSDLTKKMIISKVIDMAIDKGHARYNLIKEEINEEKEKPDKGRRQTLANLTYKFFTENELKDLYKKIVNGLDKDSLYLGAYIKLVTGLESNSVCGLKWKDFNAFIGVFGSINTKYQLLVIRQLYNDGSGYAKFENRLLARKIPCSDELAKFLLEERKRQLNKKFKGMNYDDFLELPIIQNDCNNRLLVAPSKLSEFCNKLIRKVRKGSSLLTMLPDNNKGTIETDFLNYSGDIFRSNYRYHAVVRSGFEEDEVDYLLGRQTSTTFSTYYCDYMNVNSQLLLYMKQNKYMANFSNKKPLAAKEKKLKGGIDHFLSTQSPSDVRAVTLNIDVEGECEIDIDNSFGFDVEINRKGK